MADRITISIPVEAEVADALKTPAQLEAAGRLLSSLIKGDQAEHFLGAAIAMAKSEARATGLTDEDIDAEIQAWREEPR